MASFFRKRIAQKVISLLERKQNIEATKAANLLSSRIRVHKNKSPEAELILPWNRIELACNPSGIALSPKELLKLLRNQGLPTAEGFTDIKLLDSPLSFVFTVDKHVFSKIVLLDICTNADNLAKSSCLFEDIEKKNIVVQSSSPIVGEQCNLTHFRTAVHSQYITNIHKFVGHNVLNILHMNDGGLSSAILLNGYKQFNKDEREKSSATYLFEVMKASLIQYKNDLRFKESTDIIYSKMEKGDLEILEEWKELRNCCLSYYNSIYKRIGIKLDDVFFDSSYPKDSDQLSAELLDKDIISEMDVSKRIQRNIPPDLSNVDSNFYNLIRYLNTALKFKEIYNFDDMYYIVPSSQKEFISLFFSAAKKLEYPWANNIYPIHLESVSDFESKRKKRQSIEETLEQIKEGMIARLRYPLQMESNKSLEEMADELGISSFILSQLNHRRNTDFKFDLQYILSLRRDSGAALQLCYAGLKGVQEDSEYIFKNDIDTSPLLETEAHNLIQHLARFDEMVYKSYSVLEPYIVYQYLSSLWFFTDRASNILKLSIKSDRLIVIKARLLLLSATLKILHQGLSILGITPLEKTYAPEKAFVDLNK